MVFTKTAHCTGFGWLGHPQLQKLQFRAPVSTGSDPSTLRSENQLVALLLQEIFPYLRNLMTKFYIRNPMLSNTELPLCCRGNSVSMNRLSFGEKLGYGTPWCKYLHKSNKIFVQAGVFTIHYLLFVNCYSLKFQPAKHTVEMQKYVS